MPCSDCALNRSAGCTTLNSLRITGLCTGEWGNFVVYKLSLNQTGEKKKTLPLVTGPHPAELLPARRVHRTHTLPLFLRTPPSGSWPFHIPGKQPLPHCVHQVTSVLFPVTLHPLAQPTSAPSPPYTGPGVQQTLESLALGPVCLSTPTPDLTAHGIVTSWLGSGVPPRHFQAPEWEVPWGL